VSFTSLSVRSSSTAPMASWARSRSACILDRIAARSEATMESTPNRIAAFQ
jgi:hypothetical protein